MVRGSAALLEQTLEDAGVKRAALASARRCIVVADSSKRGRVSLAHACPIDRVDVLVTDSAASEQLSGLVGDHMEVVVV